MMQYKMRIIEYDKPKEPNKPDQPKKIEIYR